jgi:hypothetical protein
VYVKPTEPRTIGGVIDDAIRIFRASWRSTWPLALATELSLLIPSFFLQTTSLKGSLLERQQAILATFKSPTLWLLIIIAVPIYLIFYNAMVANIITVASGSTPAPSKAIAYGTRLLPRALVLTILVGLIVMIGCLLFLIPGIYLWGILQLAFTAMVAQDLGVFDSMGASRRLIKGHWWRAATLFSIVFVIFIVFSFVVGFASGIVSVVTGLGTPTSTTINQLLSAIEGTLLAPLFPCALVAMYYDLKLRTEGADLLGKVSSLAA